MKTLTFLLWATLSFQAFATGNPPPNQDQDQEQNQDQQQDQNQNQSQVANGGSVGNIDNSWNLQNKLDTFNTLMNRGSAYLECNPEIGYQELDGAGYSVPTFGLCAGYEDYNDTGAITGNLIFPLVSREAKAAYRTKARNLERQRNQTLQLNQIQNALQDALKEITELQHEMSEMRNKMIEEK